MQCLNEFIMSIEQFLLVKIFSLPEEMMKMTFMIELYLCFDNKH